eukprot:GFYU01025871.1.p1 GENE.GFYU01025871.1~~GFYU01025871.1.p1  ORF type:complete len:261 (+),score=89.71 GFYU01025871.1:113-784(+)
MGCGSSKDKEAFEKLEVMSLPEGQTLSVFGNQYVVPHGKPLVLHLKAKFFCWSGDDFKVKDPETKEVYFQAQGKALSFEEKKTVFDAQGNRVFIMKEKLMQLDDKQSVFSGADPQKKLFEVSSNFGNTKQYATVKDSDGKEVKLGMKMTFVGTRGSVWIGEVNAGQCIAKVTSPVEWQNFAQYDWARDDFFVEIAPGVDAALVVAMILAYDEMDSSYAPTYTG